MQVEGLPTQDQALAFFNHDDIDSISGEEATGRISSVFQFVAYSIDIAPCTDAVILASEGGVMMSHRADSLDTDHQQPLDNNLRKRAF